MTKRTGFVFALAAIVALIVAACGGSDPTATPRPTSTPVPPTATAGPTATARPAATPTPRPTTPPPTATPSGPTPQRGGTLKGSLLVQPRNWDAYDAKGQLIAIVAFMDVFSNLIVYDAEEPSKILPDLAERWVVASDGSSVTFFLREGVKWHNGRDLKASDIVWNFERAMAAEGTTVFNKNRFATVESVRAPDDRTLQVQLKQPSASFVANIAVVFVLMYPPFGPDPGTPEFKNKESAVGTGPFKLDDHVLDVKLTYVRNDNYYKTGADGRALPYLDGIEMFFLRGANGLAAWRSGNIDCGCVWDHTFLTAQEDILRREFPEAKLIGRNTAQFHLYFNNREPWTNPDIRKAVFIALDRLTFRTLYRGGKSHYPPTITLSQSLGGFWSLPDDEFLTIPGFRVKDGKKDPADLEDARALFAKAGVDPKDLTIVFNHTTSTQDVGEIVQGVLAEIGLDVKLILLANTGELLEKLRRGDFDVALVQGGNGFDDPSDQPTRYVLTESPDNYGKWVRPDVDQLYQRIDTTFDQTKRRELTMEWQRLILDRAEVWPLTYNYAVNGPHRWVQGLDRGHYSSTVAQRHEWVWLDESLR